MILPSKYTHALLYPIGAGELVCVYCIGETFTVENLATLTNSNQFIKPSRQPFYKFVMKPTINLSFFH